MEQLYQALNHYLWEGKIMKNDNQYAMVDQNNVKNFAKIIS